MSYSGMQRRHKAPASKEEVLVALEKATKFPSQYRAASVQDVAGVVANLRGCPEVYPSPEKTRDYVAISSVKKALEELVAKGDAFVASSNHWVFTSLGLRHGNRRGGTYYFSKDAKEWFLAKVRDRWVTNRDKKAGDAAMLEIVDKHKEEFDAILDRILAEHPEPNWEERW